METDQYASGLGCPATPEERAYGAVLAAIAHVDSRDSDLLRQLVYLYMLTPLKTAHPGYFDHLPDAYEPGSFADLRYQAFGSTPKHVVEQFLFGGPLYGSITELTQNEKVH